LKWVLINDGFEIDILHPDLTPQERRTTIEKFREEK